MSAYVQGGIGAMVARWSPKPKVESSILSCLKAAWWERFYFCWTHKFLRVNVSLNIYSISKPFKRIEVLQKRCNWLWADLKQMKMLATQRSNVQETTSIANEIILW